MHPRNEAQLERHIRQFYRKRGWLAMHIHPDGRSIPQGWPDVKALGPEGQVVFIEVKEAGQQVAPIQAHVHKALRTLGHRVIVAYNLDEAIQPLVEESEE